MLISSNVLKAEQSSDAVMASNKGQGLPQEAKFSDLFASMYSPTEEKVDGESTGLPSLNVFNISDTSSQSSLIENATIQTIKPQNSQMLQEQGVDALSLEGVDGLSHEIMTSKTNLSEIEVGDEFHIMNLVDNIVNTAKPMDVVNSVNDVENAELVDIDLSAAVISNSDVTQFSSEGETIEALDVFNEPLSVSEVEALPIETNHSDNNQIEGLTSDGNVLELAQIEPIEEDPAMIAVNAPLHANNSQSIGADSKALNASVSGVSTTQTQNQAQTQLGHSVNESQSTNSSSSQSNQSFSQNGSQQNQFAQQQAQVIQQQAMKSQAIEQQLNVKAADELLVKAESKEGLLGADVSSLERRSQLPLGLQSIALPVKSPQWGQALGQRVVYMANNQLQQANITLNPEKLGPVQVKLHMDKDNQVHVTMLAQHATTREAMDNALPRLREMLEQTGVNLGSLDVGDDRQFSENAESESGSGSSKGNSEENDLQQLNESSVAKVVATDNIVDFYA